MKNKTVVLIICSILIIGGLFLYLSNNDKENIKNMSVDDIDTNIDTNNGDEDVSWEGLEEKDINSSESVNITESGIYNLSGDINENVTINTSGNVKLVLSGVNIKSNNGPAIIVEQAENVVIYLNDGTTNTLEDSSEYDPDDTEVDGVIYSKDDLIIDGNGTLIIKSNYGDGIVSKDDLKIINGNFNINSFDDGIRGKDSVYIINRIFNIESGGNGIKSTNDTNTEKGYVLIENGTFTFDTSDDAIHCNNYFGLKNGNITISSNDDGVHADNEIIIDGGNINIHKSYEGSESAKITINGGDISIDSSDDGINVAG